MDADRIDTLTAETGMPRDELRAGLSQELPQAVDELTPEGRLPTEQERRVGSRAASRVLLATVDQLYERKLSPLTPRRSWRAPTGG
jgi:hypothetical protein